MNTRRRRLCVGAALVLGATLLPAGAIAQSYGEGARGAGGHQMRPAGEHRPMPAAAHHSFTAAHHPAPPDHPMAPKHVKPHVKARDSGIVEGGFGSGNNSGGSVIGEDAVQGHLHGDNAGGNIH